MSVQEDILRGPSGFNGGNGLTLSSRLYLGRSRPGGYVPVSQWEIDAWVAEELAPRFPDGWTTLYGEGGWRDAETSKTIREHSIVVELIHDEHALAKVHDLGRSYKERFGQDAVMLATSITSLEFI